MRTLQSPNWSIHSSERSRIHPICPRKLYSRNQLVARTSIVTQSVVQANQPHKTLQSESYRLALDVLKPDIPLLTITIGVLIISIAVTLAFPLAIGDLFDVVRLYGVVTPPAASATTFEGIKAAIEIGKNPPPEFRRVLVRLCACMALAAVGNAAASFLASLLGERFGYRMRKKLMNELLQRDQSTFDNFTKGDLVARLTTDVQTLQTSVADLIGQRGVRSVLEVLGAMLMIATRNPLLALVSFLVSPVLSRLLKLIVTRASILSYERQVAAAKAADFATERLQYVTTVQVFAQEERETQSYSFLIDRGVKLAKKLALFQGAVEGGGRLAVNVGTLTLLGVGGYLVLLGRISVGTLLSFNVFNLFISVGLSSIAASLTDLGRALGALERVGAIAGGYMSHQAQRLPVESFGDDSSPRSSAPGGGQVEMRDVWFKYSEDSPWVLKGLNLTASAGSTLALVGYSGGGKTTIASLILGLYPPTHGCIRIDGRDASSMRPEEYITAVLQPAGILSGTIEENIRFGDAHASYEDVIAAAQAAYAHGFISALPLGYQTKVGERGSTLSGGQRQRIAIARALLRKPQILLLDEATSALDAESEAAVEKALSALRCTRIIIAHRLNTVRDADAIAVIVGGEVAEVGRHEDLMKNENGVYQKLIQRTVSANTPRPEPVPF